MGSAGQFNRHTMSQDSKGVEPWQLLHACLVGDWTKYVHTRRTAERHFLYEHRHATHPMTCGFRNIANYLLKRQYAAVGRNQQNLTSPQDTFPQQCGGKGASRATFGIYACAPDCEGPFKEPSDV